MRVLKFCRHWKNTCRYQKILVNSRRILRFQAFPNLGLQHSLMSYLCGQGGGEPRYKRNDAKTFQH